MIAYRPVRKMGTTSVVGKPRKTSSNSHIPPSMDGFGRGRKHRKTSGGKRPAREGKARPLTETPDKTERVMATACCHCGADVSGQAQRCRHRYDHIDLPPIRPTVTRVELFGGRCRDCGRRYRAEAPSARQPGTPFGPGIRSLLTYLHHSHHIGFERLSRIAAELFGLVISEGAVANIFRRMGPPSGRRGSDRPPELPQRLWAKDGSDRCWAGEAGYPARPGRHVRSATDRALPAAVSRFRRSDHLDVCARHERARDPGPSS